MKYTRMFFSVLVGALAIMGLLHSSVYASATLGTIDPRNVGNFKALLENTSMMEPTAHGITFGRFTTESAKNITVSNSELRGYGWGEGIGWFVTNCADTTSGCSSSNNNFKIANDGTGRLSGYAWGETTGWINFGPFLNPLVSTVKITSGLFGGTLGSAGYAWAQNFGWIKFDCSSPSSCVETDWGVTPGTCSDGIQNQDETGIDSGGVCDDDNGGGGGDGNSCPDGEVRDTVTGQCVIAPICPNTVSYASVPLLQNGQSATVTVHAPGTIGFAIQTFDKIDPSHTAGDFATENSLNPSASDQVVVYQPSTNGYVLAFEDVVPGDSDYNDLVVSASLSCNPTSGTCPTPATLGDTRVETIRNAPSGEQNLQTVLTSSGYTLDKTADQKQYQVWNTPPAASVTITAKLLARYAGHSDVFGYYVDGNLATFVPIFKTANVGAQIPASVPDACIPDPDDYCPNIAGIQTGLPPGKVLNVLGQCVDIVPDICPNIAGAQATVPAGYGYDASGNCVPLIVQGAIKITSFACSIHPTLSRGVNGPNAQGAFTIPSSCTALSGSEFGDVFLPGVTNGGGGYPYINGEGKFDVLGITDSIGDLLKGGLQTNGRHDIAETYNGGIHLPDSNRYALFCYGDNGTWTDNPDYTFVPQNGSTYCVSYRSNDLCPNIAGIQSVMPSGKIYDAARNCVDVSIRDACPNIDGYQASVPPTMQYNEIGNCVIIPVYATCYDGIQNQDETDVDIGGVCGGPQSFDICPNIIGNQAQLPTGLTISPTGQCVPISTGATCYDGIQNQDETGIDSGGICDSGGGGDGGAGTCSDGIQDQDETGVDTGGICETGTPTDLCPNIIGNQTKLPPGEYIDPLGECVPFSNGDDCVVNPNTPACLHHVLCLEHPLNPSCLIFPPIKKVSDGLLIKIITALGIILPLASAAISSLVSNPLTWSDIPLILGRGWNNFLIALGWEKRKKPWGIVYDSVTKRPIDPAYVVLRDLQGNEIATAITDINGRYGFAVDPGTYRITVNKSNYAFPSIKLAGKTSDNLYDDLYFGGDIVVANEGEIIMKNIPIDQLAFDWNEYAKAQRGGTHGQKLHFYHSADVVIYRISRVVFWVGFAFSIYAMVVSPSLWNAVVLALYVILTIVRSTTPMFHAKGSVRSEYTGEPQPYAIVHLSSTATTREVAHKVADRVGNYYGLVQNGTYHIDIDTKTDELTYDKHAVPGSVTVKKGYLKKKFKI